MLNAARRLAGIFVIIALFHLSDFSQHHLFIPSIQAMNFFPDSSSTEPRFSDSVLVKIANANLVNHLEEIGLTYSAINAVTVDNKGRIWLGGRNGLWVFDDNLFREYTYKDGLFNKNIRQLFYANEGYLWVATSSGPFVLVDNHFYLFEPLKNKKIISISENSSSWIFLTEEGLEIFAKEQNLYESLLFQILAIGLILSILSVFLFLGVKKFKTHLEWKTKLIQVEQSTLLAQMNPHFIFNSLNSVQKYIMANDKDSAHAYIQKFASMMRKVLESSTQPTITISEEIKMLELYLQLESLRFDNGFDFNIDVQDDDIWQLEIPTMLLQTFVENAVWHGLMNKENRGKIELRFSNTGRNLILCEIEDNGIGRKKAAAFVSQERIKHKSKGTQIVKKRIELLNLKSPQKIKCETIDLEENNAEISGTLVRLEIPVILA